jgi:hypothetical protein
MSSNVIFVGWNRAIPGREELTSKDFAEFMQYLGGLQQAGTIQSFEPVLLHPHGGDLNGFFLIRGDNSKLDALIASDGWEERVSRVQLHLEGVGVVRGVVGDLLMAFMERWARWISQ